MRRGGGPAGSGQILGGAELHAARLAMTHAGRQFLSLQAAQAHIAMLGEERQIVDLHTSIDFVLVFLHHDTVGAHRIIVLLLAGDFAGVASGAIIVVN